LSERFICDELKFAPFSLKHIIIKYMTKLDKLETTLENLPATHERLLGEIRKGIIGQDDVIEQLLVTLLARGHCLLTGIPGLGKTLLVKTLSKCLNLSFKRIQFTPDLMPADVVGTEVVDEDPVSGKEIFDFLPGLFFPTLCLRMKLTVLHPRLRQHCLRRWRKGR
jgi:MoxR-like ATPase